MFCVYIQHRCLYLPWYCANVTKNWIGLQRSTDFVVQNVLRGNEVCSVLVQVLSTSARSFSMAYSTFKRFTCHPKRTTKKLIAIMHTSMRLNRLGKPCSDVPPPVCLCYPLTKLLIIRNYVNRLQCNEKRTRLMWYWDKRQRVWKMWNRDINKNTERTVPKMHTLLVMQISAS